MKLSGSQNLSMVGRSVIATLKYSDHFGFPLTLAELQMRLIRVRANRRDLAQELKLLLKQKQLNYTGVYYHLPGHSSLVSRRAKRALDSAPLLKQADVLAARLATVPGILAIYLTGSLAMHNSSSQADIDLMIITLPGRLWTTRLLLTLYTSLLGLRRTPKSTHNHGKLCLNLYLTPRSFHLPATKQSLYTAYELIQAIPLYDPHNTHVDLLASNPWIADFLPNFPLPSRIRHGVRPDTHSDAPLYEKVLHHLQYWYMKNKITREHITPHSAFFHPHDPSPRVK